MGSGDVNQADKSVFGMPVSYSVVDLCSREDVLSVESSLWVMTSSINYKCK